MNYYLTENMSPAKFIEGEIKSVQSYIEANYSSQWRKTHSIRIYEYSVNNINNITDIEVKFITNEFKKPKSLHLVWEINLKFIDTHKNYKIKLFGKKNSSNKTIVFLWDILDQVSKRNCKNECDEKNNLEFSIKHHGKLTSHALLTLFFQNKKNCKTWNYKDLDEAIIKQLNENFRDYEDRGLGGERPREWKKHMGYEWITSEKDRSVPDGFVKIVSPIPLKERNERRNATSELEKEDWSFILKILNKNIKQLRCFTCGRFEGEVNRINEKTSFQKGHLQSINSGGKNQKENILTQCQYCNNTLNDYFDFDLDTLKMKPNALKAVEKQDQEGRIKILEEILKRMILKKYYKRVKGILENFIKKV